MLAGRGVPTGQRRPGAGTRLSPAPRSELPLGARTVALFPGHEETDSNVVYGAAKAETGV